MNVFHSPAPIDAAPRSLEMWRLVAITVLLPSCIAAVNYALLASNVNIRDSGVTLWAQFAWYVLQVGIVGFVVGHGIGRPLIKWLLFGWILLLINLLTAAQTMNATLGWRLQGAMAPAALMAGQMGLCVVWAFFGDTRWTWRWPAMILATGGLYFLWLNLGTYSLWETWTELLLLQVGTLSLLCGLLRLFGFRLLVLKKEETHALAGDSKRRPLQFGIKHVLIWTTALAILLGIAKGMDLLRWQVAQDLVRSGTPWKLTLATTSAMVIIIALWAALGRGHWALRYGLFLAFTLSIGSGLARWSESRLAAINAAARRGWMRFDWELMQLYEIGWWWLGWLFLCGGLLAATLIILRVLGYRLVRMRRGEPTLADA